MGKTMDQKEAKGTGMGLIRSMGMDIRIGEQGTTGEERAPLLRQVLVHSQAHLGI